MGTVYDIVTVACFACVVATYFMFTEGGTKVLAHFMLPAVAFAMANQVGNVGIRAGNEYMNALAVLLIGAGICYMFILVRR
jgi:hypothetical protein